MSILLKTSQKVLEQAEISTEKTRTENITAAQTKQKKQEVCSATFSLPFLIGKLSRGR